MPTPSDRSRHPIARGRFLQRLQRNLALGLPGSLLALALLLVATDGGLRSELRGVAVGAGGRLWSDLVEDFVLNPWFHLIVASILLLEALVPADRKQSLISKGFAVDALWLVVSVLFALATPVYVLISQNLFERYLEFLRIDALAAWPPWARFALALMVSDLIHYASHIVRHKIQPLWYFHAIHHSQKELNLFTENRSHPLDLFVRHVITFLPILMIEPSASGIVAIFWLRFWHVRCYHANIRSNFGILKYVLVTPQSHRIHHSTAVEHRDRNYGITFSIWDHLFGTQCRDYDTYPECGLDDETFPFEQDGRNPVAAIVAQLIYPFAKLAGDARRFSVRPVAGGEP
jgi:sterol desaturase/sphingolipid hydroxylase (fatty acid hydroxylase superfamily)